MRLESPRSCIMKNIAEPRLATIRSSTPITSSASRRPVKSQRMTAAPFRPRWWACAARRGGLRRGRRCSATGRSGRAAEKRALAAASEQRPGRCAASSLERYTRAASTTRCIAARPATTWCSRCALADGRHVLVNRGWVAAAAQPRAAAAGAHARRGRSWSRACVLDHLPRAYELAEREARRAASGRTSTVDDVRRLVRARSSSPTCSSSTRRSPTAWCATGRAPTPASRCTRAMRCSGTRSPRCRVVLFVVLSFRRERKPRR